MRRRAPVPSLSRISDATRAPGRLAQTLLLTHSIIKLALYDAIALRGTGIYLCTH